MKKIIRTIATLCSFLCLYSNVQAADGTEEIKYNVTQYDKEWAGMSYTEQLSSCDFDEIALENISTADLLKLAINYPLAIDIMAYENISEGFNHLLSTSNVYKTLIYRTDLASVVIDAYKELKKDDFISKLVIESIIGYMWNNNDISFDDKRRIVEYHNANNQEFGSLLSEIIGQSDEINYMQYEVLSAQAANGFQAIDNNLYAIYLNEEQTIYSVVYKGTYSKYGKSVQCYKYYSNDWSESEKTTINYNLNIAHPGWTMRSTATKKYNCHSYCWISQTPTSNIYWVSDPTNFTQATAYFSVFGYNCPTATGQKIIILKNAKTVHSAIVITGSTGGTGFRNTTRVISKLGPSGLYETTLEDVYQLYYGTTYKVFNVL